VVKIRNCGPQPLKECQGTAMTSETGMTRTVTLATMGVNDFNTQAPPGAKTLAGTSCCCHSLLLEAEDYISCHMLGPQVIKAQSNKLAT
jgi:hypothetical protein